MAPGFRKQTTYAHKRNRTKPTPAISASSPLLQLEADEDHYLSHAELSRRLLKRARRLSNPEISSKRLKSDKPTPAPSPSASTSKFETPHPSALTEEQKFKLNSSRPSHPDEVSPFPVSRRRTASRNLKENAPNRSSRKSKYLDSPFSSRPGSLATSPTRLSPDREGNAVNRPAPPKRTLSDTHFNPNIPQSASTTNSPAHSPIRLRRPSAPSPPRPGDWLPRKKTLDLDFTSSTSFFCFPPNEIDFNRPPSTSSFYGDIDSHFFDDAQDSSTPARNGAYILPADDDDDPDFDSPHDVMDLDDDANADATLSSSMKPRHMRERSPWLSDSLISPPASQDWNRAPQEGAYTRPPAQERVDMDGDGDEVSLSLGLGPGFQHEEERAGGERDLKHMFDGLALGTNKTRLLTTRTRSLETKPAADLDVPAQHPQQQQPPPPPPKTGRDRRGTVTLANANRTRSLDSSALANADLETKPKGRDRRGTIRASDFPPATTTAAKAVLAVPGFASARRTRSGTVIGMGPPRAQGLDATAASVGAGAADGAELGAVGEMDEGEELGVWCDGGWAVAAPPSPVIVRKPGASARSAGARRNSVKAVHWDMTAGPDELDMISVAGTGGAGLMPSPVVRMPSGGARGDDVRGKGKGKGKAREVVMQEDDEEDDELLLKPGFNVWE